MPRSDVDNGNNQGPRAPQQCAFCHAQGWVKLVTRHSQTGTAFRWHCEDCHYEWSAVQETNKSSN